MRHTSILINLILRLLNVQPSKPGINDLLPTF